jgi:glyoxylase I family protein
MTGSNKTIGGGGFHHVAIRARDFDKSVHFYTQALGFTKKIQWGEKPKRAIMLDTGDGNYLEIFERPEAGPVNDDAAAILHFAIRTDDCDAATSRAVAAGGVQTMAPKSLDIPSQPGPTPVRISFFKGPDGEIVEFFQNELT